MGIFFPIWILAAVNSISVLKLECRLETLHVLISPGRCLFYTLDSSANCCYCCGWRRQWSHCKQVLSQIHPWQSQRARSPRRTELWAYLHHGTWDHREGGRHPQRLRVDHGHHSWGRGGSCLVCLTSCRWEVCLARTFQCWIPCSHSRIWQGLHLWML